MTVRRLIATGRAATIVEETDPEALPEGHVRVRVAYVGVCHSDTALVAEGAAEFPRRLGHEVSGTVTESRASAVPEGSRVSAYVGDGYATEVVLPAERAVLLHPACGLLDGALAEPLACVIGGMEMLDLARVPRVVLVGAGFMGLMALRYLVAAGHPVTVIEPRERARELAVGWGADRVLHPDEVPGTMNAGCPVVIEATGGAAGLQLAGDLAAIAGTLGILGYHQSQGGRRTVDMESWNFRALRVLNLHHRDTGDLLRWMDRAQRLAAHGILRPAELVDARVGLEGLPALFAGAHRPDSIKTVVDLAGQEGNERLGG
ncbi:alcohol dehydrogenase catalytic domain-containing protein [Planctomonas deserti]|uniref:alcohol dehydrogenase catalytic domain-containing protein n=1 Tax=Planctomonas deserti TaxID=2144185 RepID=UPI00131F1FD7|nr:alcohol dehydrogenase catalytic domain-containing protein [Planctomonas deserti]